MGEYEVWVNGWLFKEFDKLKSAKQEVSKILKKKWIKKIYSEYEYTGDIIERRELIKKVEISYIR